MDTINRTQATSKKYTRLAAGAVAAFGLLCITGRAMSDPPETMAPPIEAGADGAYGDQGDTGAFQGGEQPVTEAPPVDNSGDAYESAYHSSPDTSENSVFKWTEIPENQRVPLTRAVFDQGGYQLYDTAGETVVVPFEDRNLYVMKFAVSPDDTMFFVNTGSAPVLYVPENGYLENASVPGAKWYPFSAKFHPETPVFYGIAPSYTDYCDIGWYPNTVFYGGYYGHTSFIEGGVFLPSFGLSIFIGGGHSFYGWGGYRSYVYDHPAPYHIGYFNRGVYRYAGGPGYGHPFRGGYASGYHSGFNHGFANGYHNGFNGAGREFQGTHSYNGGTAHSFGGGQVNGSHSFGGGQVNGSHSFGGGQVNGSHSFGGGGFRGSDTTFAHRSFQGSREEFNGGSDSFSRGRSFSGATDHAFNDSGNTGGRAFSGGSNDGGHAFSGGNFHANDAGGGFHGGGSGGFRSGGGGFHGGSGGSRGDNNHSGGGAGGSRGGDNHGGR